MATALGERILTRYRAGAATREQLGQALAKGWITETESSDALAAAGAEDADAGAD